MRFLVSATASDGSPAEDRCEVDAATGLEAIAFVYAHRPVGEDLVLTAVPVAATWPPTRRSTGWRSRGSEVER
jgi:hypothetical protein